MANGPVLPELTDDESEEDEEAMVAAQAGNIHGEGALADQVMCTGVHMHKSVLPGESECVIPMLTDDESEEDESEGEGELENAVLLEKLPQKGPSKLDGLIPPLRLRGSGDPMTQEEIEGLEKYEIVEYLDALGSHTDLTQNIGRLRSALLAEQISSHVSELCDSI